MSRSKGLSGRIIKSTATVSPTCRRESLRLLFSITATNKWTIKSLDIASAFLQGKAIDRLVYLIPPKEHNNPNVLWKLNKCVYGLSDAAKMWYLTVKEQIESNGIVKCPYDDAFFSNNDVELQGLMTIHVDDFIYAGSEHFEEIIVNNVLHNVDVKTMDATDFTYLGLEATTI